MRINLFTVAVLTYTADALKLVNEIEEDGLYDIDLAETMADCDCESGEIVWDEEIDDDMLAETEVDAEQIPGVPGGGGMGGNQDMAAINLIENERNMHMVPPPPAPCCCAQGPMFNPAGMPAGPGGCGCGGVPLSTLAGIPSSGLGLEHLVSTSIPGMSSGLGDDLLYKLSRGLPLGCPVPPD